MPEIKEALELAKKPLSEFLIFFGRKREKKLDVADQVSQTELLQGAGVFDIGREEVAHKGSFKGFSKNVFEHLTGARLLDTEESQGRGAKHPDPIPKAAILKSPFHRHAHWARGLLLRPVLDKADEPTH